MICWTEFDFLLTFNVARNLEMTMLTRWVVVDNWRCLNNPPPPPNLASIRSRLFDFSFQKYWIAPTHFSVWLKMILWGNGGWVYLLARTQPNLMIPVVWRRGIPESISNWIQPIALPIRRLFHLQYWYWESWRCQGLLKTYPLKHPQQHKLSLLARSLW